MLHLVGSKISSPGTKSRGFGDIQAMIEAAIVVIFTLGTATYILVTAEEKAIQTVRP